LSLTLDVALIEDILEFIGVFVSSSIAYVAYMGLKQTRSPALLRLATAFTFLGFGFLVEALAGLDGVISTIPALATTAIAGLVIAGPVMETTGYFFLAFSHAVDVVFSKRLGATLIVFPVISVSLIQATDTLSILSFYFILYGVVETVYAYVRNRKPDTLLTATALTFLGAGTFIPVLSLLYPEVYLLSLVQIILKEMGLLILFIPVLNYALGGTRINGPI
jgi:hypothetical protein